VVDLVVLKLTHAIELVVDADYVEPFGAGTSVVD